MRRLPSCCNSTSCPVHEESLPRGSAKAALIRMRACLSSSTQPTWVMGGGFESSSVEPPQIEKNVSRESRVMWKQRSSLRCRVVMMIFLNRNAVNNGELRGRRV
uniref:Uncharacterized protein n=1 Tax=Kalanchoe fedtschenkoi TaxID=63787 RepID=A0A7N0TQJ1_KALFE